MLASKLEEEVACLASSASSEVWYIDSGASWHMTGILECFSDYQEERMSFQITMGNKAKCIPLGRGTIVFQTEAGKRLRATNVLHVPRLEMNLLSISQLQNKGYDVFFIKEKVYVKHPSWKNKAQIGIRSNKLYRVQLEPPMALICSNGDKDLKELWHRRMGHLHHGALRILKKTVSGFPELSTKRDDVCKGCALGKKTWIYFLKTKCEVFSRFKEFKALVENLTGKRIKVLCSDNGGEYVDKDFTDFCAKEGIRREWTAPYIPEQKGVAERKNRIIVEAARAMLYDQDMPKFLWAEACSMAVYVQN
eukprot:PITA_25439